MSKKPIITFSIIFVIGLLLFLGIGLFQVGTDQENINKFDGDRSFSDVEYQVSLGPRTPGSEAHENVVQWVEEVLVGAGWNVEVQEGDAMGHKITNIIAQRGTGNPFIILGAHYDSRLAANMDPDERNRDQPVPGANDGASGVAVLLELSRVITEINNGQVWLVFFDTEDQGKIPGWDWILGSRYFVSQLQIKPDKVVIVDMIGDSDQNIYFEKNSNKNIREEIWDQAELLNYQDNFIPKEKHSILDDHTPFLEKGYPAVDIIDFDYPYWHTLGDTPDKISSASLEAVGRTLESWIKPQIK